MGGKSIYSSKEARPKHWPRKEFTPHPTTHRDHGAPLLVCNKGFDQAVPVEQHGDEKRV
jgi:hypothetical protein